MNQGVAFFVFQEPGDIGDADFHFQCRSYAVPRLDALAFQVLAVLVQIDETRCDDKPADVNDAPPAECFGRDAANLPAADAAVAPGLWGGCGIHERSPF